ncbi:MAG TPA: hypothetical protein VKU41_32890 [Polyangiaceae bacterium]|nr:hypothetical protein [Polyangiaceae bacterium]
MVSSRSPLKHRRAGWLALALAGLASRGALAQPRDPLTADALFREGRKAADAGDYASACPEFAESLRLDPAPGTLLNLADCEEHQGKIGSAWSHFRQLLDMLPLGDPRAVFAREHADSLDKRVPRLTIAVAEGAPAGTRVLRDDVELGAPTLGLPLPADPGRHVIVAKVSGRADAALTIDLAEGETRQVTLAVGAPLSASGAPPREATPQTAEGGFASGATPWPWVAAAAGVGFIGAGGVFGVAALSKKSASDQDCARGICSSPSGVDDYEDATTFAHVADVCFGVGLAAIGVAAYLVLTTRPAARAASSWRVLPNAGSRGGGAALLGVW